MTGSQVRYLTAPLPGELLSSFLIRLGWMNGLPAYRFCRILWPNKAIWNRDVDRSADDELLATLSMYAQWKGRNVVSLTLRETERITSGCRNGQGAAAWLLAAGIYHRKRTLCGLQYCPECLTAECPYFMRSWRLGFVLVCEKHGCPLRDACPHCDAPLAPHRLYNNEIDACHCCYRKLTVVPVPTLQVETPVSVILLQKELTSLLERASLSFESGLEAQQRFASLRILLAELAIKRNIRSIRNCFELPPASNRLDTSETTFEYSRRENRMILLETLAAWIAEWPKQFLRGACSAGLTQRSFSRYKLSNFLRVHIEQLPVGHTKRRTTELRLYSVGMLRLRRKQKIEYRERRAAVLLQMARRK